MYGELSKASTTQAKLQAQGGIHKAVSIDSAESSIKAATQKGAVTEQAAQLAGGGEGGKKIADAIKNASADGADLMAAGIIRAAQNLGAAQSGAKTASDMEAVLAHGGKEQYIADKVSASTFKETSEAKQAQIYDNQDMMNKRVAGYLKNYGGAAREERVQNLVEQGILEEGSTGKSFKATTGKKARRAWAEASAGAMNKGMNVMFSGERVNLSQDMATGETLANIDGSTREVQGHSYQTNAAWKVAEKLFPNDIEQQKAYVEGQQMSKEVSQNWGTSTLSAASVRMLDIMGIKPTDENRETMQYVIMSVSGAAVTVAGKGIQEIKQRYNNAKNGKFTAKEDFTYTDSKGKIQDIKAGTNLDIPQDELEHFNENYRDKVSARKGKAGQSWESMKEKLESVSPFSGKEKTNKSSTSKKDNKNPNTPSDKSQRTTEQPQKTTRHDNSLINETLLDSDTPPSSKNDYNTKNFKNQTSDMPKTQFFTIETILYLMLKSYKSQICLSLS